MPSQSQSEDVKQQRLQERKKALLDIGKSFSRQFGSRLFQDKKHIMALAERGNTEAIMFVANAHVYGMNGFEQNFSIARNYYEKLKDRDTRALYEYALTFFYEDNSQEAKKYLRVAVKKQCLDAMYYLARIYLAEFSEIHTRFKEYNYSDMHAMVKLFRKIYKHDPEKLKQHFEEEGIDIYLMINVFLSDADKYLKKNDPVTALDLCSIALRMTSICPRNEQTESFKKLSDVGRSDVSNELFKRAKEGNHENQYQLAYCLEKGIGFKQNSELAKEWYRKASEGGYQEATKRLNKLLAKNTSPIAPQATQFRM